MSRVEACNVQDFILSASALSTSSLDLSRKGITELPLDIPGCSKLECLYLEGNRISTLPESLFTSCPNLRWLDLRNNKIETLPPSIDKLKTLRTLLLEGNKIKSLPPQLGRLCHLTGLNLTRNPLEFPPKHIVEQGTKVTLKFLRDVLNEADEDDKLDSSDSTNQVTGRLFEPLHPIENNHGIVTVGSSTDSHSLHGLLPLPLMRQATLHAQTEGGSKRKHTRPDTPSPHHSPKAIHIPSQRKKQRRQKRKVIDAAIRKPNEFTVEERTEITTALEKQKHKQGVDLWRQEARAMQRQQEMRVHIDGMIHYSKAVDTAPFATDNSKLKEEEQGRHSEAEATLKAMDTQRETLTRYRKKHGEASESMSSLRDARESEVSERIHVHMLKLAEQRKQAGIISTPSSELLQAEKKLAEAIARRKDFEDSNNHGREYRLTAFTGDEHPS